VELRLAAHEGYGRREEPLRKPNRALVLLEPFGGPTEGADELGAEPLAPSFACSVAEGTLSARGRPDWMRKEGLTERSKGVAWQQIG